MKDVCAIEEKELNKVELAYFTRPKNQQIILCDRDANRLLKGQIVPHLNLKVSECDEKSEIHLPMECRIQVNEEIPPPPPSFSYEDGYSENGENCSCCVGGSH